MHNVGHTNGLYRQQAPRVFQVAGLFFRTCKYVPRVTQAVKSVRKVAELESYLGLRLDLSSLPDRLMLLQMFPLYALEWYKNLSMAQFRMFLTHLIDALSYLLIFLRSNGDSSEKYARAGITAIGTRDIRKTPLFAGVEALQGSGELSGCAL